MPSITPAGAERIRVAHERYVVALREYNGVRCAKPRRGGDSDYAMRVSDAQRRFEEIFAEWATLFEHETGRKLAI